MPTLKHRWECVTPEAGEQYVQCTIDILPRGGGNKRLAALIAVEVFGHELMRPHLIGVDVTSSRVRGRFRPGPGLVRDWLKMSWANLTDEQRRQAEAAGVLGDVPGQMLLSIPGS